MKSRCATVWPSCQGMPPIEMCVNTRLWLLSTLPFSTLCKTNCTS